MTEAPQDPSARPIWSVSSLLLAMGDTLSARFGSVAVQGELSGFTRAASGHCYFGLKDAQGQAGLLRCAMFRRSASLLDFAPAEGLQVELRGRVAVYEARGELQLVVESMRRLGAGSLYEQFLRLRAKLEAEGLFAAERKRRIGALPRTVGVVTSTAGAALHDVLTALARRAPHVRVIIYPSPVQGAAAPPALAEAITTASRRCEVDTLLLVRGGGSIEDLWAFNDEQVVRAVAACAVPVVSGVGHETDLTLCDLVADLRAPTPTAAAELAATPRVELLDQLQSRADRARRMVRRHLDGQAQGLDTLALRLGRPARVLKVQHQALERLAQRLRRGMARWCERERHALPQRGERLGRAVTQLRSQRAVALEALGQRLQAVDPKVVLRRGYAWVEDERGVAIVAAAGLQTGDRLRAVWSDGVASVDVVEVDAGPPASS